MMDRMIEFDYKITLWLNEVGTPFWDKIWVFITDKYSSIPLYFILLYFLIKKYKRSVWIFLLIISCKIAATDQTSNLVKNIFARLRPCQHPEFQDQLRAIIEYSCPNSYGFFSAHAANSAAIAVFFILSLNLKGMPRILLIVWSIMHGCSRIYLGVHYLSDVLVGFVVGGIYGFIFYTLANYIYRVTRKKHGIGVEYLG